jgi:hypothetical protein
MRVRPITKTTFEHVVIDGGDAPGDDQHKYRPPSGKWNARPAPDLAFFIGQAPAHGLNVSLFPTSSPPRERM